MRRISMSMVALGFAGALALAAPARALAPQDPQDAPQPSEQGFVPFTADQLDNLVAPIALYADPLLAQVLLAATFPDQIREAAEYVRANGTTGIDDQYWDVSVKAVAHYPTVLNLMDQRIDWTTSLGQAYAAQSTDVMQAIQHMRQLAQAQGNLRTTPEQEVVEQDGYVRIWPAQARYIYVPVYDPAVVFVRPIWGLPVWGTFFSFGIGYPIGAWLIYDWDWPMRRIYYTGWWGGGWIGRSRPFIHITNVYINSGYRRIHYDRDILFRRPDYGRIHRYTSLYPGISYAGRPGPSSPPLRYAHPRDGITPDARALDGRTGRMRSGAGATAVPASRPRDDARRRNATARNDGGAQLPRVLPMPTRDGSAPQRNGATEQPHALPTTPGVTRDGRVPPGWVPPKTEYLKQPQRTAQPQPGQAEPRWVPPRTERPGEYPGVIRSQPARSAPRWEPPVTERQPQPGREAARAYPTPPRAQPADAPRYEARPAAPRPDAPSRPEIVRPDPPRYEAPRSEPARSSAPRYEAPRSEPPRSSAPRYEAPRSEPPRSSAPRYEAPRSEPPRGGGWRAAPPPDRSGPVMRSGGGSEGRGAQPRGEGGHRR